VYRYKDFGRNAGLLFLLWLLLSGKFEPTYLVLGLMASIAVAWLHELQPEPPNPTVPFLGFMRYLPWLMSRILMSNLHVAYLILHPRLPIAPALIRYQTQLRNPAAVTLLANSITLTPGTVTAEVLQDELVVHALDKDSTEDVMSGRLEGKIAEIFK
jgi:multicomponent Na+:H+ antiporter subunit E